MQSYFSSCSAP